MLLWVVTSFELAAELTTTLSGSESPTTMRRTRCFAATTGRRGCIRERGTSSVKRERKSPRDPGWTRVRRYLLMGTGDCRP